MLRRPRPRPRGLAAPRSSAAKRAPPSATLLSQNQYKNLTEHLFKVAILAFNITVIIVVIIIICFIFNIIVITKLILYL